MVNERSTKGQQRIKLMTYLPGLEAKSIEYCAMLKCYFKVEVIYTYKSVSLNRMRSGPIRTAFYENTKSNNSRCNTQNMKAGALQDVRLWSPNLTFFSTFIMGTHETNF